MDRGWGIEPQPFMYLLKLCFLQFNTIQSKLHHFEARDYQPAVNFSLAENIKLLQQLRNQMEISINLNRSCPAVSQIWSLMILSSICIRKAPNSTPTVISYSYLNSFSVSLIKRELFPTPENLIVTSNAIFCIISIIYLIKPPTMWSTTLTNLWGWIRNFIACSTKTAPLVSFESFWMMFAISFEAALQSLTTLKNIFAISRMAPAYSNLIRSIHQHLHKL